MYDLILVNDWKYTTLFYFLVHFIILKTDPNLLYSPFLYKWSLYFPLFQKTTSYITGNKSLLYEVLIFKSLISTSETLQRKTTKCL